MIQNGYNWIYLHQGGRMDPVTGLYNFDYRDYSATLGRWAEEEPSGAKYIDGMNLYEYLKSGAVTCFDAQGTHTQSDCYQTFNQEWSQIAARYAALMGKGVIPGWGMGAGIAGGGGIWIVTGSGPIGWAVGGIYEGLDGAITWYQEAEYLDEMHEEEKSVEDALKNCLCTATGP